MRRNDRRDLDWRESTLIRAGHHIWAQYKRERAKSGDPVLQQCLLGACELIWAAKRELRASLAKERSAGWLNYVAKSLKP